MNNPSEPEEWRAIPSLPQYEASNLGRIRRIPYEAPMPHGGVRTYGGEPWFGAWDKEECRFVVQFKRKTYRVARLVCEAFHGPPPFPEAVAMHKNEDSRVNRADNLEWGTQKQNLNAPGYRKFRRNQPGRPNSKTNAADRAEIIRRGLAGERVVDLARAYGLSPAYVSTMVSKARAELARGHAEENAA